MRYLVVTCMLLASLSGATAAQMTHEETVVRSAYAKFAYAAQQRAISDLADEADGAPVSKGHAGLTSDQRLADAQVNFTLQDFVVGDAHDILKQKAFDLISPAMGEVLSSSLYHSGFDDRGLEAHCYALDLGWAQAHALSAAVLEMTISDLLQSEYKQRPQPLWQRYALYSVTVSYHGKSRGPYKAMFLFGRDDKGHEVIGPHDATTSTDGLTYALSRPLFPDTLVLTHLRTFPVVSNWLDANQMPGSCSAGVGDVCCDLI
ncbi:MAG: hypothetical protein WBC78_23560, partial [Candidatus Sulfotelmatobacter sp.]